MSDDMPSVCSGSGTCPPSLQGQTMASSLRSCAPCGICLQVVQVAWSPLGPATVVHPYRLVGNAFVIHELRAELAAMTARAEKAEAERDGKVLANELYKANFDAAIAAWDAERLSHLGTVFEAINHLRNQQGHYWELNDRWVAEHREVKSKYMQAVDRIRDLETELAAERLSGDGGAEKHKKWAKHYYDEREALLVQMRNLCIGHAQDMAASDAIFRAIDKWVLAWTNKADKRDVEFDLVAAHAAFKEWVVKRKEREKNG